MVGRFNAFLQLHQVCVNWWDVILFRYGITNKIHLSFRNGKKLYVERKGDSINFNYKGRSLVFHFGTRSAFLNQIALGVIREQFVDGQYAGLKPGGRVVVDIGANIGDSALYFALNGAKHVYAYEPFPYSFEMAKRNIEENGLGDRISIFNVGLGKEDIVLPESNSSESSSTIRRGEDRGRCVKLKTLDQIVKYNKIESAVLKMDCEGAEHEAINEAKRETLRKFDRILMEYHGGYDFSVDAEESGRHDCN